MSETEGPRIRIGGDIQVTGSVTQAEKVVVGPKGVQIEDAVTVGEDFDPENPPDVLPLKMKAGNTLTIKGVGYRWDEERGGYTRIPDKETASSSS